MASDGRRLTGVQMPCYVEHVDRALCMLRGAEALDTSRRCRRRRPSGLSASGGVNEPATILKCTLEASDALQWGRVPMTGCGVKTHDCCVRRFGNHVVRTFLLFCLLSEPGFGLLGSFLGPVQAIVSPQKSLGTTFGQKMVLWEFPKISTNFNFSSDFYY